jgi:diaminopimelate decarboxylase
MEVRDGALFVGGVSLVELAQREGTALYVMDEEHIRVQLRRYRSAFADAPSGIGVVYAGKAFIARALCDLLAEEDCLLDVSSGGELFVALAAGFDPGRVVVHGNNKTPRELAEAIEAGVGRVVVDSLEELELLSSLAVKFGAVQPVFLRIKPGIVADTHEYVQTGAEDSKFGFGLADGAALEAVLRARELAGVQLKGLHVHIGSQIFSLDPYRRVLEVMAGFMAELRDAHGVVFEDFDLGGGLGIAYGLDDAPSSIEDFARVVSEALRENCAAHGLAVPRLLVEPGRSVAAVAGVALYTVGCVKVLEGVRTYVAVDGGMSDNIRTVLYGAHYEALVASRADEPRDAIVTIVGKHCESGDVLIVDASLQAPTPGDIVCVLGTGAYCRSMASNYNMQPRPAVVFVRDGTARTVLRRETYSDLLACDVL